MIIKTIYWEAPVKDCWGYIGLGDRLFLMQCDYCGEEFESSNERKKYCCDRCRDQAGIKNRKEQKAQARKCNCQVCSETFLPPRNDAKFCSDACRQSAYRKRKGVTQCEESKPFLLECFRLPEDERKESPLGYYNSSLYTNGIGFDKLIEKLESIQAIKDKVKIEILTKYERLERQEVYFNNDKYSWVSKDPEKRYPFLVLSKDSILMSMPMAPGDKQLEYLLTQIILEEIVE